MSAFSLFIPAIFIPAISLFVIDAAGAERVSPAVAVEAVERVEPLSRGKLARSWEEALERMRPWKGTRLPGVDSSQLEGKVVCGYQGWFAAEGDEAGAGWVHYGDGVFKPGVAGIDLWPDMSEMEPDEHYATAFRYADGSQATVFSSYHPKTVRRHFEWMKEYGIDGAFLQRFGSDMRRPDSYDFCNAVLVNVRRAANETGRVWIVMYDLSGLQAEEIESVIIKDWKQLVDRMEVRKDASYLHHRGKPLVAVWGVGFDEGRRYSVEDCHALIDFLKNDPKYGGNSIMLGVPFGWREGKRDAVDDPAFRTLIAKADLVSPWSVTRYGSLASFRKGFADYQKRDIDWCREQGIAYLPVIFPGFSWVNLLKGREQDGAPHFIARDEGRFLWGQGAELVKSGAEMIYIAMFDELDEGTAIMKTSTEPPIGESRFQVEAGLPSDHYLWLAGQLGRLLRKEIPLSEVPPTR